jgi:hypothetical protein
MNFLASSSLFTANGMEHHVPKFMGQCMAQSICRRVYLDKEQHWKFPEMIPTGGDFHLFSAAWRAISWRLFFPMAAARARPPLLPSATAVGSFPSDSGDGP